MKKEKIAILVGGALILLVGAVTFIQIGSSNKDEESLSSEQSDYSAYYTTLEASEVLDKIRNGDSFQFIDIDSELDYEFEHIVDSVNLPYTLFDSSLISPDKNVILIMRERNREVLVDISKKITASYGLGVYYLAGGVSAWSSEGGHTVSWGNPALSIDQVKVSYISSEDLRKLFDEDREVQLIDLRSPEKYSASKLPEAINIPLDELERRRHEVSVSKPVIFYSDNDLFSFQASVRIYDMRLLSSHILKGGIGEWSEGGDMLN